MYSLLYLQEITLEKAIEFSAAGIYQFFLFSSRNQEKNVHTPLWLIDWFRDLFDFIIVAWDMREAPIWLKNLI